MAAFRVSFGQWRDVGQKLGKIQQNREGKRMKKSRHHQVACTHSDTRKRHTQTEHVVFLREFFLPKIAVLHSLFWALDPVGLDNLYREMLHGGNGTTFGWRGIFSSFFFALFQGVKRIAEIKGPGSPDRGHTLPKTRHHDERVLGRLGFPPDSGSTVMA